MHSVWPLLFQLMINIVSFRVHCISASTLNLGCHYSCGRGRYFSGVGYQTASRSSSAGAETIASNSVILCAIYSCIMTSSESHPMGS
jgi:hypothetical protein